MYKNIHSRSSSLEKLILKNPLNTTNQSRYRSFNVSNISSSNSLSIHKHGRVLNKQQQFTTNVTNNSILCDNKLTNSRSTITISDLPTLKKQNFYHHSTIHNLSHFQSTKTSHENSLYQSENIQAQNKLHLDSSHILKLLQQFRQRVKYFLDEHRDLNTKHIPHNNKINLRTKGVCDYPIFQSEMGQQIIRNKFNYDHNSNHIIYKQVDHESRGEFFFKQQQGQDFDQQIKTNTSFAQLEKSLWIKLHPFLRDNTIDYDERMRIASQQYAAMIKNMQTLSFNIKIPEDLKNDISDYNDYYQVIKIKQDSYIQSSSLIEEILDDYIGNMTEVSIVEQRCPTPLIQDQTLYQEMIPVQSQEQVESQSSQHSIQYNTRNPESKPKKKKIKKQYQFYIIYRQSKELRFISQEHDLILRQQQLTSAAIVQSPTTQLHIEEELCETPKTDQIQEQILEQQIIVNVIEEEKELIEELIEDKSILQSLPLTSQIIQKLTIGPVIRQNNIVNIVRLKSISKILKNNRKSVFIGIEPIDIQPINILPSNNLGPNLSNKRQKRTFTPPIEQIQLQQVGITQYQSTLQSQGIEQLDFRNSPETNQVKTMHQRISQMGIRQRVSQFNYQPANDELMENDLVLEQFQNQLDERNKRYEQTWIDYLLDADDVFAYNIDEFKLSVFDINTLQIPVFEDIQQQTMYESMVIWKNEVMEIIPILQFEILKRGHAIVTKPDDIIEDQGTQINLE